MKFMTTLVFVYVPASRHSKKIYLVSIQDYHLNLHR
jgi:hypothetical protein